MEFSFKREKIAKIPLISALSIHVASHSISTQSLALWNILTFYNGVDYPTILQSQRSLIRSGVAGEEKPIANVYDPAVRLGPGRTWPGRIGPSGHLRDGTGRPTLADWWYPILTCYDNNSHCIYG